MLKVNNINKKIKNKHILKDVSFSIEKGDALGIIGPHDSGKSTLMNIIAGIGKPASGNVLFNYLDIFENSIEVKKSLAYVPQFPVLYLHQSVIEYLDYVCELRNIFDKNSRLRQIEKVLETFSIQDLRYKLIKNLTRSNKQKLNIAQALIGSPDLLILDEPTVGLDVNHANEIRTILKNLTNDTTIIISSFVLPELSYLCDRILVMDKGRVIANDSSKNLSKDYYQRNVLMVDIEGDTHLALEVLEDMPEILDISIVTRPEKTSVRIELDKNVDIRKEVFQKLSNVHMLISNMSLEPLTLEDLFGHINIGDKKTIPTPGKIIDIRTKRLTGRSDDNE